MFQAPRVLHKHTDITFIFFFFVLYLHFYLLLDRRASKPKHVCGGQNTSSGSLYASSTMQSRIQIRAVRLAHALFPAESFCCPWTLQLFPWC